MNDNDTNPDPLAPAKGIANGCGLSLVMWALMAIIWAVLR